MDLCALYCWCLKTFIKFTERLQQERQQALEKMGISVQASGIQVEKNKYYLVNLNADPSLNELLVYYLKVCFSRRKTSLVFVGFFVLNFVQCLIFLFFFLIS